MPQRPMGLDEFVFNPLITTDAFGFLLKEDF